ncbi:hypothetical protein GOP47_0025395 [Adiantum capillus-veneris]|uniref:Uncharacterized protein n=1 Tax=Adiantum capillus-veneris TaxID=13818 RepID=A0A9D4U079_ADICA|nr:hypothetical protein GOP47_0025395 [Adiantum capillus-veneris]
MKYEISKFHSVHDLVLNSEREESRPTVGASMAVTLASFSVQSTMEEVRRAAEGGAVQVQSTMVDNLQAAMHSVDHMAQDDDDARRSLC